MIKSQQRGLGFVLLMALAVLPACDSLSTNTSSSQHLTDSESHTHQPLCEAKPQPTHPPSPAIVAEEPTGTYYDDNPVMTV